MTVHPTPNAKPKILGSDTHAANLTGNSSISDSSTFVDRTNSPVIFYDNVVGETFGTGPSTDFELAGTTVNVASVDDIVIVVFYTISGPEDGTGPSGSVTWDIAFVREAEILQSATHSGGNNSGPFTDRAILVLTGLTGSNRFGIRLQNFTATGTRRLGMGTGGSGGVWISTTIVSLTDTHAASLDGSNTQRTHEAEVIQ